MAAASPRILLTGAAGVIGADLRNGLAGRYPLVRLTDLRDTGPARSGEETVCADLTSLDETLAVTLDIDVVLHFAGVPREGPWDLILANNIEATFNVFEAARRNRVGRVVYASSNHVVGFYRNERALGVTEPARPDSRYGVSKLFGEGLGRLYADKHGLSVVCLRIGSYRREPENHRQLATWCSPRDLLALVVRCIEAPALHFEVFYGVSGNRRRRWSDDAERKIAFTPQDDAERYAGRFGDVPPSDTRGPAAQFHGGHLAAMEFDGDPEAID
jgi:uronate dehydrogenase